MNNTNSTAEHLCPRRAEAVHQTPGPDRWDGRAILAGGIGPCCTYCGSLNPNVFMQHVRDGWIVEPSDKVYKCYLSKPHSAEELERIKTSDAVWKATRQLKLDEGATDNEATAAADAYWSEHEAQWRRGSTVAKFYYQHLSHEQRDEFIGLHNTGAMQLAYPGYFYVRPFFCSAAEVAR